MSMPGMYHLLTTRKIALRATYDCIQRFVYLCCGTNPRKISLGCPKILGIQYIVDTVAIAVKLHSFNLVISFSFCCIITVSIIFSTTVFADLSAI